jgi:hypothetical protein
VRERRPGLQSWSDEDHLRLTPLAPQWASESCLPRSLARPSPRPAFVAPAPPAPPAKLGFGDCSIDELVSAGYELQET